ncbi:hypothetical protein [Saccharothrix sp. ST-888]|uniref:hypothetical protein n=1 Tax=Saccharothrix sp. ST-888 TaxID=1427391 RepID=UPI0005EBFD9E|nr:hypothetical protein [Saccharothrix sp. ST-888]KJK55649.1 hypothetical protein UK12_27405 [Saccharothrix sp. ST-888]
MTTPAPIHQYTFLFCDLITDRILAELPVQQVEYSTELNGIGTFSGMIPLNDQTAPLAPMAATIPGRTMLYVDRDGVIVWGGIVWTRKPLTAAYGVYGMHIQAAELPSYWQHRYVNEILSTDPGVLVANGADGRYVPDGQRMYDDQAWILWSLLRYAGADITGAGDIHVDTNPLVNPTGVTRVRTYDASQRPAILDLIRQLSEVDGGFDWGVEVGYNADGSRYRRWQVYYPRRGRSASATGFMFQYGAGGNALTYEWPEDGTLLANRAIALGAGQGQDVVIGQAEAGDQFPAGWPLLETVTKYDQVVEWNTIQAHAQADLYAHRSAMTTPTFTVLADADPVLGSYTVGDSAIFAIDPDGYYPNGYAAELRIVSIKVSYSGGPETVALTCTGA